MSEEKPSPVVQLSKIKELTMVRGDIMKNIEYNFCWNTVSIRTESRRAGRQKYLARGPFVLKESEDTPVRSDLNIMKYLDIHCPGFIDTTFAEQDSGEKLLWTAHVKYGWDSILIFPESLWNAKGLTSISFKIYWSPALAPLKWSVNAVICSRSILKSQQNLEGDCSELHRVSLTRSSLARPRERAATLESYACTS